MLDILAPQVDRSQGIGAMNARIRLVDFIGSVRAGDRQRPLLVSPGEHIQHNRVDRHGKKSILNFTRDEG